MVNFYNLPFHFIMSLYRTKIRAETENDTAMLKQLEMEYPELFSMRFEEFISDIRNSIEYIYQKYGEDFKKIIGQDDNIVFH